MAKSSYKTYTDALEQVLCPLSNQTVPCDGSLCAQCAFRRSHKDLALYNMARAKIKTAEYGEALKLLQAIGRTRYAAVNYAFYECYKGLHFPERGRNFLLRALFKGLPEAIQEVIRYRNLPPEMAADLYAACVHKDGDAWIRLADYLTSHGGAYLENKVVCHKVARAAKKGHHNALLAIPGLIENLRPQFAH